MSLLDRARQDARRIVSSGAGFAFPITFTNGVKTATVNGTGKKHHIKFDDQGAVVNALNATVTVAETDLTDAGYPIRDVNGEISLRDHTVTWADAKGTNTYEVSEWFPDEHLGLIVLILRN